MWWRNRRMDGRTHPLGHIQRRIFKQYHTQQWHNGRTDKCTRTHPHSHIQQCILKLYHAQTYKTTMWRTEISFISWSGVKVGFCSRTWDRTARLSSSISFDSSAMLSFFFATLTSWFVSVICCSRFFSAIWTSRRSTFPLKTQGREGWG